MTNKPDELGQREASEGPRGLSLIFSPTFAQLESILMLDNNYEPGKFSKASSFQKFISSLENALENSVQNFSNKFFDDFPNLEGDDLKCRLGEYGFQVDLDPDAGTMHAEELRENLRKEISSSVALFSFEEFLDLGEEREQPLRLKCGLEFTVADLGVVGNLSKMVKEEREKFFNDMGNADIVAKLATLFSSSLTPLQYLRFVLASVPHRSALSPVYDSSLRPLHSLVEEAYNFCEEKDDNDVVVRIQKALSLRLAEMGGKPEEVVESLELEEPDDEIDSSALEDPDDEIDSSALEDPDDEVDSSALEEPDDEIDSLELEGPDDEVDSLELEGPDDEIDSLELEEPDDEVDSLELEDPDDEIDSSALEDPDDEIRSLELEGPDEWTGLKVAVSGTESSPKDQDDPKWIELDKKCSPLSPPPPPSRAFDEDSLFRSVEDPQEVIPLQQRRNINAPLNDLSDKSLIKEVYKWFDNADLMPSEAQNVITVRGLSAKQIRLILPRFLECFPQATEEGSRLYFRINRKDNSIEFWEGDRESEGLIPNDPKQKSYVKSIEDKNKKERALWRAVLIKCLANSLRARIKNLNKVLSPMEEHQLIDNFAKELFDCNKEILLDRIAYKAGKSPVRSKLKRGFSNQFGYWWSNVGTPAKITTVSSLGVLGGITPEIASLSNLISPAGASGLGYGLFTLSALLAVPMFRDLFYRYGKRRLPLSKDSARVADEESYLRLSESIDAGERAFHHDLSTAIKMRYAKNLREEEKRVSKERTFNKVLFWRKNQPAPQKIPSSSILVRSATEVARELLMLIEKEHDRSFLKKTASVGGGFALAASITIPANYAVEGNMINYDKFPDHANKTVEVIGAKRSEVSEAVRKLLAESSWKISD